MPLQATSVLNLRRNKVVRYINARGQSRNAVIRAITGATLTLWIPSERRTVTTAPKPTTVRGVGFHHR